MAARPKRGFWRTCRIYFRRFRISVWMVLLVVVLALVYLNQIGLPGPLKRMLLDNLRGRGLDLQFSRLRLRWYQGIVAENVRFGQADEPLSPRLSVAEIQVELNWRALLLHRQILVDSLRLRQGQFEWPMLETNGATRLLSINDIHTELRFLPDDQWALEHFTAVFAGGRIELSGQVAHASAIRGWAGAQPAQPAPAGSTQQRLKELADVLEHIHFSAPPRLNVDLRGDALDLQSFKARLRLDASGVSSTPWGTARNARFTGRLFPDLTNGLMRADLNLLAAQADTPWGATTNLQIAVQLVSQTNQPDHISGNLLATADRADTEWAQANVIELRAQWVHSLTNPVPLIGQGQLLCKQPHSPWASARALGMTGRFSSLPSGQSAHPDSSWAWWEGLAPYQVDWECRLEGAQASGFNLDQVACSGQWAAPELVVTNLQAQLGQSWLDFHARLDVASRALRISLATQIDPHRFAPLFSEPARRELTNCSWPVLPRLQAEAGLALPPWKRQGNSQNWSELLPTVWARGQFDLTAGGAYRQIGVTNAHTSFIYSNGCCFLPDLLICRPEGRLQADCRFDHQFHDLHAKFSSTIDWRLVRPLLDAEAQQGVDLISYAEPPRIEGEVWERLDALEQVGFRGSVNLTNFSFRGESARSLQASLAYTNLVVECFGATVERDGGQHMQAEGFKIDIPADVMILTNGYSTADPRCITRAIGPQVDQVVIPYHFTQPPVGRVHGVIPLHGDEAADLHFDIEGGAFQWWKFNVPHLAAHVHWRGKNVSLSDVRVNFYGGDATGYAAFDFRPEKGPIYHFSLTTTNTQLQALMADLSSKTNQLDGRLSGTLVITRANAMDDSQLEGYGSVNLQDGLIWDIPIFGIVSPVLDGINPGLGHSRANAGTGTFFITNAVIYSDDLLIHCTGMSLAYRGTVDLEQRVNARVEAKLLPNVPLVGPMVRTALWPMSKLFEYKVNGTLGDPKTEPVYVVPNLILMPFQLPFHPWRTLKGLLPKENGPQGTFAPAQ